MQSEGTEDHKLDMDIDEALRKGRDGNGGREGRRGGEHKQREEKGAGQQ